MPVPKRKVSKARRDQRSACKNIDPKPYIMCPNPACKDEPLLPHMACPRCGFYRRKKVISGQVDQDVAQSQQVAEASLSQQSSEAHDTSSQE